MKEDIDKITELRDTRTVPFQASDIEIDTLRQTLRKKRKLDEQLLTHIHLRDEGVTSLTAEEAAAAFNAMIDSDFYLHIQGDYLRLRPEIRRLLDLALQSRSKGMPVEREIIQTLNRALLYAVYPDETVKSRQYERFMIPEMLKMTVTISPLAPVVSEDYEGKLLNISAGGMALLLPKKLPELTHWVLRISFADHSEIETVVQIRHSMAQQDKFVHGFQFVDIPSYLNGKVETFASDFSSCEERIKEGNPNVCRTDCTLFANCPKPQRLPKPE